MTSSTLSAFSTLVDYIGVPFRVNDPVVLKHYSVGDATCTIAASTTFPEPFITPSDRRRLGWAHKSLAGNRHSDHVALLNAFQMWEEARFVSSFNCVTLTKC